MMHGFFLQMINKMALLTGSFPAGVMISTEQVSTISVIAARLQTHGVFPVIVHTNKVMRYEWDEQKNRENQQKHGLDFSNGLNFCWDTAMETVDDRVEYVEEHWIAPGCLGDRVHVLIYTFRADNIRLISLRKANKREVQFYETGRKYRF
jgi:uncharacterized DUF497 family protein